MNETEWSKPPQKIVVCLFVFLVYIFCGIFFSAEYKGEIQGMVMFFVYYESIKREIKTRIKPIYECRCDERLQPKTKRSTLLSYTGLVVELEHLKIKTRLTNEKFASVKGECEI